MNKIINSDSEYERKLKEENLKKIKNMSLFEDDWNGTGGRKFTPAALAVFTKVINSLKHQPQGAPTGRNSLYMEYTYNKYNVALGIELCEDKCVSVVCSPYFHTEERTVYENFAEYIESEYEEYLQLCDSYPSAVFDALKEVECCENLSKNRNEVVI